MTILIFGGNGQLGRNLISQFRSAGRQIASVDLPDVDITAPEQTKNAFERFTPRMVVNAAAYTAVDRAENEPSAALAANCEGPKLLAAQCKQRKIPLIHISTDYVFDGKSHRPYREEDPISPIGVYAQTKAEGESAVRKTWPHHIIVRTSWLFAATGANFVRTMLRLGTERKEIRVVDDQYGCPTSAADLATAIVAIVKQIETSQPSAWGTYHYCGAGETSWYDFACKIFEFARNRFPLQVENIVPIPSSEYPTPAPRPPYSVLDCRKIKKVFGITQVPWEDSLQETVTILFERSQAL